MAATILPNAKTQFFDGSGNPLAGGSVTFYIPATTTPKATWQDYTQLVPNTNPIILDASGEALIFGQGAYRQIVKDALGNQIWDQVTVDSAFGVISTAMAPVVAAATTTIALALLGGALPFANIAALRAYAGATAPPVVYVEGYYAQSDDGEGAFTYVSTDTTSVDNGGTIIVDASSRRWYRETSGAPVNLKWFGAKGDGATDDSAAIAKWLAIRGALTASAGTYVMATAQTLGLATTIECMPGTVTFKGTTPSMQMFTFGAVSTTLCNISIRGVNFDGGANLITAVVCTLGVNFTIADCEFSGIAVTANLDRVRYPEVRNAFVHGNGSRAGGQLLIRDSTGGGALPVMGRVENYVNDCSNAYGTAGSQISPLILLDTVETIEISGCQATGLDFLAPGTISHIEVRNLSQGVEISDCVSVGADVGIKINGADTVGLAPSYIGITNCDVDSFNTAGILVIGTAIDNVNLVSVTGGFITAPGATTASIYLIHTGFGVIINGVTIFQWQGLPAKSGYGVVLEGTRSTVITGCYMSELTTALVFTGAANSFLTATDNRIEAVTNVTSGTTPTRSNLSGNQLDALAAPTVPTLPASTATVTNTTGYWLQVNISGGTVTVINLNGVTTGLTSGSFMMQPGGLSQIQLVYAVAPNWAVAALS